MPSTSQDEQTTTLTVRLDTHCLNRLRTWAMAIDMKMGRVIEQALNEFYERRPEGLETVDNILQAIETARPKRNRQTKENTNPVAKNARVTRDEIKQVQQLALKGTPAKQIAKIIGRPYSTTLNILHRYGRFAESCFNPPKKTQKGGKDSTEE